MVARLGPLLLRARYTMLSSWERDRDVFAMAIVVFSIYQVATFFSPEKWFMLEKFRVWQELRPLLPCLRCRRDPAWEATFFTRPGEVSIRIKWRLSPNRA